MKDLKKLMLLSNISGELACRRFTFGDDVYSESYANQSFAVLFWTLLYCPKELDLLKCLKMAMFYNLHNWEDKTESENDYIIVEKVAEKLNKPEILWVYEEFIQNKTLEAKLMHDIIKVETIFHLMYLQKEKLIKYEQVKKLFEETINDEDVSGRVKEIIKTYPNDIIKLIGNVKDTERGGFHVRLNKKKNGKNIYNNIHFMKGLYETDGDHTFGLCLLLYFMSDDSVVLLDSLKAAVLHDTPEGKDKKDYTPMCKGANEKLSHETDVMVWLALKCQQPDFIKIFNNYNKNELPSYIRVKSADKLEFLLKAIYFWKMKRFPLSEIIDIYENYKVCFNDKIKDHKVINYMILLKTFIIK